jgi:hypothetical protein
MSGIKLTMEEVTRKEGSLKKGISKKKWKEATEQDTWIRCVDSPHVFFFFARRPHFFFSFV